MVPAAQERRVRFDDADTVEVPPAVVVPPGLLRFAAGTARTLFFCGVAFLLLTARAPFFGSGDCRGYGVPFPVWTLPACWMRVGDPFNSWALFWDIALWALLWAWFLIGVVRAPEKEARQPGTIPELARVIERGGRYRSTEPL